MSPSWYGHGFEVGDVVHGIQAPIKLKIALDSVEYVSAGRRDLQVPGNVIGGHIVNAGGVYLFAKIRTSTTSEVVGSLRG